MNPMVLAPTTLMMLPPLELIEHAASAGYDGMGIRLYPSPNMPFFPVVGDKDAEAKVRAAIRDTGVRVYEIFTCYLQPDMDTEAMMRAHEFGRELGADWAVIIGDDDDWGRMVDNFGRLCDNGKKIGLTMSLEVPVNRRKLNNFELNMKLASDAARENVCFTVDPVQFIRAGDSFDLLKDLDPRFMPSTQIGDSTSLTPSDPFCMPGEGIIPLKQMFDIMPQGIPLTVEYHFRNQPGFDTHSWAKHVLDGTRAFMESYYAERAAKA